MLPIWIEYRSLHGAVRSNQISLKIVFTDVVYKSTRNCFTVDFFGKGILTWSIRNDNLVRKVIEIFTPICLSVHFTSWKRWQFWSRVFRRACWYNRLDTIMTTNHPPPPAQNLALRKVYVSIWKLCGILFQESFARIRTVWSKIWSPPTISEKFYCNLAYIRSVNCSDKSADTPK